LTACGYSETPHVPESSRAAVLASGAAGGIEKQLSSGDPGISGLSLPAREGGREWEGVLNSIEEKLRSVGVSCSRKQNIY
jgi:hypothetical protein